MIKNFYQTLEEAEEAVNNMLQTGFSFQVEKISRYVPSERDPEKRNKTWYELTVLEPNFIKDQTEKITRLQSEIKDEKETVKRIEKRLTERVDEGLELQRNFNSLEKSYEDLQEEFTAYTDVYTRKEDPGEEEKADETEAGEYMTLVIRIEKEPMFNIVMPEQVYRDIELLYFVLLHGEVYEIKKVSTYRKDVSWFLEKSAYGKASGELIDLDAILKIKDVTGVIL